MLVKLLLRQRARIDSLRRLFFSFPIPLHLISFFALFLSLTRTHTNSLFHSFLLWSFVIFCVFLFHWNRFGFIASLSLVSGCGCAVRVYFTRWFTKMCAFAKHHTIERNVFACACMCLSIIYIFVCVSVCVT